MNLKTTIIVLVLFMIVGFLSVREQQQAEALQAEILTTSLYIVTDDKEDGLVRVEAVDRALEDYDLWIPTGYPEHTTLMISVDQNGEPLLIQKQQKSFSF